MSRLRNEIEKLLKSYATASYLHTEENDVEPVIADYTSQILSLLESVIPKEKAIKYMNVKNMDGKLLDKLPMLSHKDRGYNQCIADMKTNLKGK